MSSKPNQTQFRWLFYFIAATGMCVATYFGYQHFSSKNPNTGEKSTAASHASSDPVHQVRMSEQACANLGLCSAPCTLNTYWRKLQTTGVIIDRPGFTDRGITSPIDCVVAKVHAYNGDIVRPGQKLFTLRLASEHLQNTQADYFKAISEIKILNREITRIEKLANSGVIPEKRIIQLKQNINRQQAQVDANRQELIARGLTENHLEQIASGDFIKTLDVLVPNGVEPTTKTPEQNQFSQASFETPSLTTDTFLELQELKVELGQQVATGQILAVLSNHNNLYISGHAFKKEAANIARAAELNWEVEVEFLEDSADSWEKLDQTFTIRHLSNTIDTKSRTFDFFIPLTNQSRSYMKDDKAFVIWRFRPGQRVRIHVPIEKLEDVVVVPSAAVVSDGPENYVFQQNGELYERIPVHVIFRDRINTVIANDQSVLPGMFLAQNSAASLNRVLKSQAASGENVGNFHVHADGTVHSNH